MGTGPAGRDIFTVGVTTRRSGYSYGIMKCHTCIYILVYYENPYVHLLQNWPLFARDPLECFQKRAFSETQFLLGFSVSGFPTEGGTAEIPFESPRIESHRIGARPHSASRDT